MEQTITVFGMILHPKTPQILLVPSLDGWDLPHFTRDKWELWSCVSDVNEEVSRRFGFTPVTLRCHDSGATDAGDWLIYAVECPDPQWLPPSECRWATCDEISHERLLLPHLRSCVREWFSWETHPAITRVSWYQRGWAPSACTWMTTQITALGTRMSAPPQQRRSCQRSAVWEIPTTEKPLFFKAVPPYFHHEIAVTQYLAEFFPATIPCILAVDETSGWMLMDNAGNRSIDHASGVETWCTALNRYAEIQVDMHCHIDRLAALGCPVLSTAHYGDMLSRIMLDSEALTPVDLWCELTVDERKLLQQHLQDITAAGQRLANSPIPLSIDHGDFWSAQILLGSDSPKIIDWSDASITMPFFSLFKYLIPHELCSVFPEQPDVEDRLRDAYLDPWLPFASRDQLLDLYDLARSIAALHNAVFTYRYVMPSMEVRWEQGNMIPYYLKQLCKAWS